MLTKAVQLLQHHNDVHLSIARSLQLPSAQQALVCDHMTIGPTRVCMHVPPCDT